MWVRGIEGPRVNTSPLGNRLQLEKSDTLYVKVKEDCISGEKKCGRKTQIGRVLNHPGCLPPPEQIHVHFLRRCLILYCASTEELQRKGVPPGGVGIRFTRPSSQSKIRQRKELIPGSRHRGGGGSAGRGDLSTSKSLGREETC